MPKRTNRKPLAITPEQALDFLEDFRKLQAGQDEQSKAISLRVPANILRTFKIVAAAEGRPYQAMMIEALRDYLKKSTNSV